jgi:hypothetical protein
MNEILRDIHTFSQHRVDLIQNDHKV